MEGSSWERRCSVKNRKGLPLEGNFWRGQTGQEEGEEMEGICKWRDCWGWSVFRWV